MRLRLNEFAKMRHLRIAAVALTLVVAVTALSVAGGLASEPGAISPSLWLALLAGMSVAYPLVSPLLVAVMASRVVDIEHQGNGWLAAAVGGVPPGRLCRAKFAALAAVVAAATIAASASVLLVGLVLAPGGPPTATWAGFTVSALAINLVLLAVHILLAAVIDNQLVGLGLAVLGTLAAVFAQGLPDWLNILTPWGFYAFAQAADFLDGGLSLVPIGYAQIAVLTVLAALAFSLFTHHLDRREA